MTQPSASADAVQVRTYQGRDQAEANAIFQEDANQLATAGYRPTAQTWSYPSRIRIFVTPVIVIIAALLVGSLTGYTVATVIIAAILSVFYILYASARIEGTLSVTYTR